MSNADTCIFCGEIIPEERQVCHLCEQEDPMGNRNNPSTVPATSEKP